MKMDQIEVTVLKNTVTRLKKYSTGNYMKQKKRSVNLKTGQWKSPNQSNIKKKKERKKKSQESIRDFEGNSKWTNMHIMKQMKFMKYSQ